MTSICGPVYVNCSICRVLPCSFHYNANGMSTQAQVVAMAIENALNPNVNAKEAQLSGQPLPTHAAFAAPVPNIDTAADSSSFPLSAASVPTCTQASPPGKASLACSLNGACTASGACACDKPWGGDRCGVLQYKTRQAVSAKNLYPLNDTDAPASGPCVTSNHTCGALNTWNGPIVGPVDNQYHMFNPLYRKGSLLATIDMMHGVADTIEGPYTWSSLSGKNMG